MANISIQFDGDAVAKRLEIAAKGTRGPDMTKLIGERFLSWVIGENFRKAGAEKPWKKLEQSTIDARRKGPGGRPDQILRDTGTLMQSFQKGTASNVFRNTPIQVTVGTETEYAIYHDSDAARSRLPQRKLLPSEKLAGEMAQQVVQAVLDKLAKDASR